MESSPTPKPPGLRLHPTSGERTRLKPLLAQQVLGELLAALGRPDWVSTLRAIPRHGDLTLYDVVDDKGAARGQVSALTFCAFRRIRDELGRPLASVLCLADEAGCPRLLDFLWLRDPLGESATVGPPSRPKSVPAGRDDPFDVLYPFR